MKVLKECIINTKVTDYVVTCDFNEDVCSKNTQDFMLEVGLLGTHEELNIINKEERCHL